MSLMLGNVGRLDRKQLITMKTDSKLCIPPKIQMASWAPFQFDMSGTGLDDRLKYNVSIHNCNDFGVWNAEE